MIPIKKINLDDSIKLYFEVNHPEVLEEYISVDFDLCAKCSHGFNIVDTYFLALIDPDRYEEKCDDNDDYIVQRKILRVVKAALKKEGISADFEENKTNIKYIFVPDEEECISEESEDFEKDYYGYNITYNLYNNFAIIETHGKTLLLNMEMDFYDGCSEYTSAEVLLIY